MSSSSDLPPPTNPYQAPAEAIDFVEADDAGRSRKSSPRRRTIEALRETLPWVKLMGGLGALLGGLGSLGAVLGLIQVFDANKGWQTVLWLALRFAFSIIYLTGAILLLRYASLIGDLLVSEHPDHLDAALEAQKSFWRFVGMSCAILLLLLTGGFLFLFLGAGISSFLP